MDSHIAGESPAQAPDSVGLGLVRDLLRVHQGAGIAIADPGRPLGDAGELLAASGIDVGDHPILRGTAAAEYVPAADAWVVGSALSEAVGVGRAQRSIHLRDGREASLYLIRVDELRLPSAFVMVIASDTPGAIPDRPTADWIEPAARVGVLYVDGFGVVTNADDAALDVLRRTRAAVDGQVVVSIVAADDQETAIANWVAAKERRGVPQRWRGRAVRGDGSLLWIEVTITNRIDDAGVGDVRVELNDISREIAASEALADERSLLKLLTETLPVGVAKFDAHGRIEYSNGRLARLLGGDPAVIVAAAVTGGIPSLAEAFSYLLSEGRSSKFVGDRRPEQPGRDLEWTLQPVTSATGEIVGGVVCVADVTEATELRAALEQRATTDALTGCLNWAGTMNCLQTALRAASDHAGVGLMFIDLNGFKGINDRHGHAVGDRVLEFVAGRLRNAVRPLDKIGRLGGDEFVVVAPGLASLGDARALAERVSAGVNRVASVGELRIGISASTGVAWANSGDADVLLAEADRAMYAVKYASPSDHRDTTAGALRLPS